MSKLEDRENRRRAGYRPHCWDGVRGAEGEEGTPQGGQGDQEAGEPVSSTQFV